MFKDFNDPKSTKFRILLINTKLGSTSLNLHGAACKIVIMEFMINLGTLIQILGRINRMGQEYAQQVYLLWTNHSFDQIELHRVTRKGVAAIAGEGSVLKEESSTEEDAEERFRLFLGLQHSAWDEEWRCVPYTNKDASIARQGGGRGETDADEVVPTSLTNSARKPRPLPALPVQNRANRKSSPRLRDPPTDDGVQLRP
jgi:hypothetical protein